MGVRAVIVVGEDSGRQRRFWAAWASPEYQIRYVAQLIHTADHDGTPLNVDAYIAFAATYPGTLPADDITEEDGVFVGTCPGTSAVTCSGPTGIDVRRLVTSLGPTRPVGSGGASDANLPGPGAGSIDGGVEPREVGTARCAPLVGPLLIGALEPEPPPEINGDSDPAQTGDLDHRYRLLLSPAKRSFRYLVYKRGRHLDRPGWRLGEDLRSRGELYEAAARMCRNMAAYNQRYMARNNGFPPPHGPSLEDLRQQEREFVAWLRHTDPPLLQRPGPPLHSATRYTLAAARRLAREISARLRRHYPGVTIRTRLAPDGVLSVTVPVRLACDTDTALITEVVGDLLGQLYTVDVRLHRPSRRRAHVGNDDAGRAVNATLTLRPADAATDPASVTKDSAKP